MGERLQELASYKRRALTAEVERRAGDVARSGAEVRRAQETLRGASRTFAEARRATRETGALPDPRLGRFYAEALSRRLIADRRTLSRVQERLCEAERRHLSARGEVSALVAKLERLRERDADFRLAAIAHERAREDGATLELWRSRGSTGEGDDGLLSTTSGGDEGIGVVPKGEASTDLGSIVAPGFGAALPGTGEPRGEVPSGLVEPPHAPGPGCESLGGGVAKRTVEPGAQTLHRGVPGAFDLQHGAVTAIERRGESGVTLTYRGVSGGVIEIGVARSVRGAVELSLRGERSGEGVGLERERRGIVAALREGGYTVGRVAVVDRVPDEESETYER